MGHGAQERILPSAGFCWWQHKNHRMDPEKVSVVVREQWPCEGVPGLGTKRTVFPAQAQATHIEAQQGKQGLD